VRRRAGCGEVGESGAKRYWRFCFAEWRAVEEWIFALVSVDIWVLGEASEAPLDGDIML